MRTLEEQHLSRRAAVQGDEGEAPNLPDAEEVMASSVSDTSSKYGDADHHRCGELLAVSRPWFAQAGSAMCLHYETFHSALLTMKQRPPTHP